MSRNYVKILPPVQPAHSIRNTPGKPVRLPFATSSTINLPGAGPLAYGLPNPGDVVALLGGGIYAITPPAITAATENNTINISGVTRSGSLRSTLAGIIIDSTPSTTNVPVTEVEPDAPARTIVGSVSTSAVLTINAPFPVTYEAVQASQKPLLWLRYSETTVPVVNTSSVANSGSTGVAGIGTAKRYPAFPEPGALVGDGDTLRKSTVNATHTAHLLNQAPSFGGNQKTPAMSSCPRPCRCVMTLPRPAAA